MGMEQSKMKKAEKTQTFGMKHSDTIAKSEGKRRSALQIMGSLIGLVKPLLHIMLAAIVLGMAGYLCAIFLTILAGQVILHGLQDGVAGKIGNTNLTKEEYDQIDPEEMELIDIRWCMASAVRRAQRFMEITGRKSIWWTFYQVRL